VYLTHDSMSVRKAHNSGRNHLRNVVDYYQRRACLHPSVPSPKLTKTSQKSATRKPSPSSTRSHPHMQPKANPHQTPCSVKTPASNQCPPSHFQEVCYPPSLPPIEPVSDIPFRRPTSTIRHARNAPNAGYASPRRSPTRHDPTTRRPRNAHAALPARTRHASSASRDAIPTSRWSPSEFPVPAAARWIPTSARIPAAPWRSWVRSAESGTAGRARSGSE
jgi:hypothetical protein